MRIIRINEVLEAIKSLSPIPAAGAGFLIGLDPYSWVVMWRLYKLDEVDFDQLRTIHSQTSVTTQAFIALAKKLKLTVELVHVDDDGRTVIFTLKRGLITRYEEVRGNASIWEEREYNQFEQLTRRRGSSGLLQIFNYDQSGKLTDTDCNEKTEKHMRENTNVDISEDGTILEISC